MADKERVRELRCAGAGVLSSGKATAEEAFVFLHGWSGSKEQWWPALAELGKNFQCVALDLPGTGGSAWPDGMQSMGDMAAWVREICGRLGLEQVTIVGHSLGGNLAAQTALDDVRLVKRLVLVDAALETSRLPRRAHWMISPKYGLAALGILRAASLPLSAMGRGIGPDEQGWRTHARRTHLYTTRNTDHSLQRQLRALVGNPLDATRLRPLNVPLLIVHGARDHIIPLSRARALQALPRATLRVFPQAFHCPMDTNPDLFAETLRAFAVEETGAWPITTSM